MPDKEYYKQVISYAKSHYENFPVISFLIPKELQKHVAVIYWFARTADDISDEGNFSVNERLEKINHFRKRLHSVLNDQYESAFESALGHTIKERKLTPEYFFNLLKAFSQDVVKIRYDNIDEVMDYCSNSANPVGRLILELFGIRSDKANYYSDKICTALQITNFLQDTMIDFQKGRIYFPIDEMSRFNVTEKMFDIKENNLNFKSLVEHNVDRTQQLFNEGKKLTGFLQGRLKFEIRWTINGGEMILNKIRKSGYDVMNKRPVLSKVDYFRIMIKSFLQ